MNSLTPGTWLKERPNSPLRDPKPVLYSHDDFDAGDEVYASEDESSQSSTFADTHITTIDPHYQARPMRDKRESAKPYLPKVLGFSADDPGTEDWKEVRAQMLSREALARPPGGFNEDYAKRRAMLVEWMTQTSETVLALQPLTVHMAVAYLDKVVAKLKDQYIKPSRLQLMATACMLAAGVCPSLSFLPVGFFNSRKASSLPFPQLKWRRMTATCLPFMNSTVAARMDTLLSSL